jgi:hypothetical protein
LRALHIATGDHAMGEAPGVGVFHEELDAMCPMFKDIEIENGTNRWQGEPHVCLLTVYTFSPVA